MRTIFLDMDGVVADFGAMAEPIVGHRTPGGERYNDSDWTKIASNARMYAELEKCPGADILVNTVLALAFRHECEVKFLSAVPKQNDVPWAFWDKINWVKKHWGDIPVWFGPYSNDKYLHCKPGDILIDDRNSNIAEWNAASGIGILHVYGLVEDSITSLKKALNG